MAFGPDDDDASDAPSRDEARSADGGSSDAASSRTDPPGATSPDDAEATPDPAQPAIDLLAEGVPMALVADLIDPAGPPSPVYLEEEGLPAEAWWEPDFTPAPADDDAPDQEVEDGPAGRDG